MQERFLCLLLLTVDDAAYSAFHGDRFLLLNTPVRKSTYYQ